MQGVFFRFIPKNPWERGNRPHRIIGRGQMIKKVITVRHKYGIHARPAARIVSLCNGFAADIQIVKEGEQPANAKNILDIMMLAAACGSNLELRADGADEEEAMAQLAVLMESDFDTNEI